MNHLDEVILGINHMFLYPESMTDADIHTKTLALLADNPYMDALDCWVWSSHAREELAILKDCGKVINYNIGDRKGDTPIFPATEDPKERAYAMEILRRETDFAMECGAKKIIFGSGRDVPHDRAQARKRFEEFVLTWSEYLPDDVWLMLGPVDWDIDKHSLYGDLPGTCETVRNIRRAGFERMSILLDMGHIPIMYESLESAVSITGDLLGHIHLGNCILKNPMNPLYGDKHPCWGAVDGEYDENDGECFLKLLKKQGYLSRGCKQTNSFEMRPLTGRNAEETVHHLAKWFDGVYEQLRKRE